MRRANFIDLTGRSFDRLYVICEDTPLKDGTATWFCLCTCGNTRVVAGSDLRRGKNRSCGCFQSENQKDMMSGSKHLSWKGGISSERTIARTCSEYNTWRYSVFVRDQFTCCKCGVQKGPFQAHHILSFAKYEDYRYDITNGITFCTGCHMLFHSKYGKTDFSPADVHAFIGD